MIRALPVRFDVSDVQQELKTATWNAHGARTKSGPHRECDDIWVRYASGAVRADGSFDCDWWQEFPATMDLCHAVTSLVEAQELGGVLITRIPAGKQVYPHADFGWHAEHYDKFAVQIHGNKEQSFCFEDCELRPETGDLYTFVNQRKHWVLNPSSQPRVTLIVCARAH